MGAGGTGCVSSALSTPSWETSGDFGRAWPLMCSPFSSGRKVWAEGTKRLAVASGVTERPQLAKFALMARQSPDLWHTRTHQDVSLFMYKEKIVFAK